MADELPGSIGEWLDFMPATVTIDAWVSQNVSGVPTYAGSPVSYPARIEMKNHYIIDAKGREIMAKGRVIMGTTTAPSVKDLLTLPSSYVPTQPPILAVNLIDDENGPHHVTLEIG